MTGLIYLIPIALILGFIGLLAFIWSIKSGQFDDLDGAAYRVLFDDDDLNDSKLKINSDDNIKKIKKK